MIVIKIKNPGIVTVIIVIKIENREIVSVELVETNIHAKKNVRKMRDFHIVVITITKNVIKLFIIIKIQKIKMIKNQKMKI